MKKNIIITEGINILKNNINLNIHISTQNSSMNIETVEYLKSLGIKKIKYLLFLVYIRISQEQPGMDIKECSINPFLQKSLIL